MGSTLNRYIRLTPFFIRAIGGEVAIQEIRRDRPGVVAVRHLLKVPLPTGLNIVILQYSSMRRKRHWGREANVPLNVDNPKASYLKAIGFRVIGYPWAAIGPVRQGKGFPNRGKKDHILALTPAG